MPGRLVVYKILLCALMCGVFCQDFLNDEMILQSELKLAEMFVKILLFVLQNIIN